MSEQHGFDDIEPVPEQPEPVEQYGIATIPYGMPVTNIVDATRVVSVLQLLRDTAGRKRAQAEQEATLLEREADRIEATYTPALAAFTRSQLAGKVKSITLATGQGGDKPARMGFRTVKGGLRIVDKEAAVAWAELEKLNDLLAVEVVTKPIADRFKAWYEAHKKETGEVPDGCIVEPDKESFRVS
jgi:hypothetical protein